MRYIPHQYMQNSGHFKVFIYENYCFSTLLDSTESGLFHKHSELCTFRGGAGSDAKNTTQIALLTVSRILTVVYNLSGFRTLTGAIVNS
jgi:hypothetical protein